ncbi:hypothetical protein N7495_002759 [Penicillium taxi]|uniref:uncharacterized protein n=1 Tax=Penicillium taxi TaxID=168475 RepID=UPI0025450E7E|nr:uncharacterized protein N7495_002759 [Penicillium taxi]KAJ5902231.1 hypothetical protein N7495_002759 [Penicillium taxi]
MQARSQHKTAGMQPFNLAKEREFYRYLPSDHSVYPFAPFDDESQNKFIPQPSQDHALLTFAEMGAIKLGAQRAMISLFGPTHQYVLAEATGMSNLDNHDNLWLGCCVLPREKGICKVVTDLPLSEPSDNPTIIDGSALVMLDLRNNKYFNSSELAPNLSQTRYFIGVPIISPRGITIGSYCVLDTQPRELGPDEPSLTSMKAMARTIMGYLDTVQSRNRNRQAERMIKGLGSFAEGKATLRDSWDESNTQNVATKRSGETVEGQLNQNQQDLQEARDHPEHRQLPYRTFKKDSPRPRVHSKDRVPSKERTKEPISNATTANPSSVILSDESVLDSNKDRVDKKDVHEQQRPSLKASISDHSVPTEGVSTALKNLFSRAANLIRESIEVEGVAFYDASIDSFGGLEDGNRRAREAYARGEPMTSSSDDSTDGEIPFSKAKIDDTAICRLFGLSTSTASSIDGPIKSNKDFSMRESLLKSILNRYPHGKIFNFNESGSLSDDSSTSGSNSCSSVKSSNSGTKLKKRKPNHRQDANELIKVLVGARSVIFLPMWNSHKSKWLAGVLVWTNTPKRVFTSESELTYLRSFGNSIMAEVHRLDVEMAEKAKANLISSISHELRSPLHGILGTSNILSDTALNALQHGMVHTIESCGRTLLDTINHVLDFSYIDKFKNGSAQHKHAAAGDQDDEPNLPENTLQKNTPTSSDNSYPSVQLDSVLEEVVESVFAGHSFYNDPIARSRDGGSSKVITLSSKPITVILDIHEAANWAFSTQAGCWRRILMNVFGNALKYTPSGFIYLELKVSPVPQTKGHDCDDIKSAEDYTSQYLVRLIVKDTGKGIDVNYLRNDLFTAFSQEDSLAPGSGLGLSIVRQALISLGGTIDVSSEKNHGTEITIEVPLCLTLESDNKSDDSSFDSNEAFNSIRNLTRGKTMRLIGLSPSPESEKDLTLQNSLERLCRDWFHLTIELASVESVFSAREKTPPDFNLIVQTSFGRPDSKEDELHHFDRLTKVEESGISPLIVICHSPETAHNMFARATSRNGKSDVHFISQPCGPRKLAKALNMCMHRQEDQSHGAQDDSEPTRWVEMPESSYLPLDIGPRDPPNDRMKLGKRPTDTEISMETMAKQTSENQQPTSASEKSSPSKATVKQIPDNAQPSILLVDDNELNLKILVAFVKKEGWSYITANNGLEAVETYKAHPGKFGAIILDLTMPVMNGFEATQNIRFFERKYWLNNESSKPPWHPITIAALTGLDSANVQQEAFACGIDMFLTKPVTRQGLRPVFQKVRR